MEGYLSVGVHINERSAIVSVDGELDLASSPRLEQAIAEADRSPRPLVVLDLKHLRFIDMAGLRVLLEAHERTEAEGRRLVLTNVPEPVRRVLALAQVDELLPLENGE